MIYIYITPSLKINTIIYIHVPYHVIPGKQCPPEIAKRFREIKEKGILAGGLLYEQLVIMLVYVQYNILYI